MIKLDLHIHSQYSEDGIGSPKDIIKSLKKRGLQGMAITDHNSIDGGLKALKIAPKDFIVIPGVEISTLDGHMIALDIKENVQREISIEETVEKIIELGGTPIVPHLYRNMSGIKREKLEKIRKNVSAIEVFNACSVPKTNLKTIKVAKELNLGGTGGSDSHNPLFVGYGYTVVNTTDLSKDAIISEIQKKKTWGEGLTLPLSYRRERMIRSIKQFFQRGFQRIWIFTKKPFNSLNDTIFMDDAQNVLELQERIVILEERIRALEREQRKICEDILSGSSKERMQKRILEKPPEKIEVVKERIDKQIKIEI